MFWGRERIILVSSVFFAKVISWLDQLVVSSVSNQLREGEKDGVFEDMRFVCQLQITPAPGMKF